MSETVNRHAKAVHRFDTLDSLRGLCACLVALFHFQTQGRINGSAFIQHSFLFVDFFFVLSGFVISASYGSKLADGFSIPKFMGLRMGRIYPLHLFMLTLFFAFEIVKASGLLGALDHGPFQAPNDLASLLAAILLLQPFLPLDNSGWNNPSWSIQVEMWTYLIYAMLFRFMRGAIVPVAIAVMILCIVMIYRLPAGSIAVTHEGSLERCVYGFSAGVVAFQLQGLVRTHAPLSKLWASLLEAVAIVATFLIVRSVSDFGSLFIPAYFALVVLLFSQESGAISALLKRPFPRWIGLLSFSIYMIHRLLIYRLLNLLAIVDKLNHHRFALVDAHPGGATLAGGALFGDAMSIAFLALVIGCAHVSYRLIEKPAQAWSRRRLLGPHPARTVVVGEAEAPTF